MTNEQIITEQAVRLFGEEDVRKMIENGIEPPLHTLQGWAARGYKVKKGSHAVAETKLWKKKSVTPGRKSSNNNAGQTGIPNAESQNFYMSKAFLFSAEQVEKIGGKND
jgi:hypothetical protein